MDVKNVNDQCSILMRRRDVFLHSIVGFDGELKTLCQHFVDVIVPCDVYDSQFMIWVVY